MKVLVPGVKKLDDIKYLGQCKQCHCIFEFTQAEIPDNRCFYCPTCEYYGYIDEYDPQPLTVTSINSFKEEYQQKMVKHYSRISSHKYRNLPIRKDL